MADYFDQFDPSKRAASAPGIHYQTLGALGPGGAPPPRPPPTPPPTPPPGQPPHGEPPAPPPGGMPGNTPPPGTTGVPPGLPPPPGQPGSLYGNKQAFRDALLASGGRTVADLKAFVAAHPEFGVTIGGTKGDKVYGPGNAFWADAVISAGTGGNGFYWNEDTGGGSGGAGGMNENWLSPFTGQAGMPTLADLQADPGYQIRLQEGLKGVQTSAAAKGTLLSGGTLKGLERFGQDFASNEYSNLYNRQFNNLGFNRDTFYQNQTNPYSKLFNLSQLGKPNA